MAETTRPKITTYSPGPIFGIALYLISLAVVIRSVVQITASVYFQDRVYWILGMEFLFLVLFTLFLWRPTASRLLANLYFFFQCALLVILIVIARDLDYVNGFFMPLSYLAALNLCGRPRQAWIAVMVILSAVPLMLQYNPLRNLALSLPTMAAVIVIAAYIAAAQEEDAAQAQSRAMLDQLRETHRQLQVYASQVEELAAIDERNRLARELHDSVSQTMFSIILNVRASQMLLDRDPSRLRPQLERLNGLTQSALAEMRSLIAQLRPKNE